MGFKVKIFLAYIFDKIGISKFLLWRLGRKLERSEEHTSELQSLA